MSKRITGIREDFGTSWFTSTHTPLIAATSRLCSHIDTGAGRQLGRVDIPFLP
jgi:hypothetical protein